MMPKLSTVAWVQLPAKLQMQSGGCWQERCYPFRGVFAEHRAEKGVEMRRMLDDCWLALKEFEDENQLERTVKRCQQEEQTW